MVLLAMLGFVSATFVVEGMACSNALLAERESDSLQLETVKFDEHSSSTEAGEKVGLVPKKHLSPGGEQQFSILRKVEMSEMASLFLGSTGSCLFYASIIVYLYGDLAIYAVAVPKSLRDLVCPLPTHLSADTKTAWDCGWLGDMTGYTLDSSQVYRCFCGLFSVTFGPCAFLSITESKWLQLVTTVLRYLAFAAMIVVSSVGIAQGAHEVNVHA